MKFAIQTRNDDYSNKLMQQAKQYLLDFGLEFDEEEPEIVLSIGGDGTFLHAFHKYAHLNRPMIILDFGTANTFCALLPTGEYLGGAIAPGIGISTEALFQRAAKLPRIELVKPKTVICRNTVSSMQAGAIYGFVGQMEGIVNHMKKELGGDAFVIATGGFANTMAYESDCIDVIEPFLTLDGLRILYEKNAK